MNKAFLREPDQGDSLCPACGSIGQTVGPQTLAAQLPQKLRRRFAETAAFCRVETCRVIYFDDFGARVERGELDRAIPIKDPDAPLCGCFGLTRDDIELDVEEGGVKRTRDVVLRAQSPDARCSTQAPNGRSCLAEVQGYYVRCKQRHDG